MRGELGVYAATDNITQTKAVRELQLQYYFDCEGGALHKIEIYFFSFMSPELLAQHKLLLGVLVYTIS